MEKEFYLSQSSKEHKFFEKYLTNDLFNLTSFLQYQYERIKNGEILKGVPNSGTEYDSSNSVTTINWNLFNAFQFYHPAMHKLTSAVKEMTLEACDYYNLNFNNEQFYIHSWFNINYAKNGKLDWHEHGGGGAPFFHGYYCVNAEPSITHYSVFGKDIDNINKNNRAILSETGHPHAMADWDWDGPRITIAYDVIPLRFIPTEWEQHFFPLV